MRIEQWRFVWVDIAPEAFCVLTKYHFVWHEPTGAMQTLPIEKSDY
jgi:hypothetical protein